MDYVDLAAHVTAMVVTIMALLWVTWPKSRSFPFWTALVKVTLFAVFVWLLSLGIDLALRSLTVTRPPPETHSGGRVSDVAPVWATNLGRPHDDIRWPAKRR